MSDMNKDFMGATEIEDSHISMFANFPYISIDLENFRIYETKDMNQTPLVDVHDVYIGFNLWTIITGKMEIKKIKLKDGEINLVQHKDGQFNIVKALSPEKEIESPEEEFHLDLKKISLENIDISKLNEANNLKIEAFVQDAHSKFKTNDEHIKTSLDARFILNLIKDGDTTFLKHKHLDLETNIDFEKGVDIMTISPTELHLEGAQFGMEGSIDFLNDVFLDLKFEAKKHNFDLFIALAPESVMHTLKEFKNEGDIYIESTIKGKSINGHNPDVELKFGCKNGSIINPNTQKKLSAINFDGHFTNGKDNDVSTMEFNLKNFSAKPEAGTFNANIDVKDFRAPEIDLDLQSTFKMKFIDDFLDLEEISDVTGDASIDIKYRDVIDLENPQHALSRLNEEYEMQINLNDLGFKMKSYDIPVSHFDLETKIHGHLATIIKCDLELGKSDLNMIGTIDDLPAIIHHTDIPVDTRLKIKSSYLNLYELTGSDSTKSVNEEIRNLSLDFDFKASARSFTESKYLPVGEFFIENLYAELLHYPHKLHDFHADIFVEDRDLRVVDFKGMIDKSDFLFTGKLEHYEKWFDEHPGGDSNIEFDLYSNMLQLESLFTYKGDNYVPEEYRHEEFDNLHVHGWTYLHYADELKSMDLNIDKFEAKMKVHPLRFENFKGRVHYEDEHLVVEDFHGKLGHSNFKTTLHYYLGDNEKIKKRDNHFSLVATRLDVDQLIKYNPAPAIKRNKQMITEETVDHDAGFNIYELPFTDMTYHIDVGHFNYHRFLMKNVKGELHTTPDHYLHIDHLVMDAAGGHFDITGYFNGSNPDLIYLKPRIEATNIDLDKLMFKFENFGQDHVVSENLHGKFTGVITGKIHVHNDLVPKIDDSEIHMDLDVTHGRLENYSILSYMSDYFKDKNLNKVLFDTLNNHVDLVNGEMVIPAMKINSSLGHMEISGKQDINGNMEYYLKIPWRMISSTASSKLFGRKKEEIDPEREDEIIYAKDKERYVNVIITGDENGYNFKLGKKKRN